MSSRDDLLRELARQDDVMWQIRTELVLIASRWQWMTDDIHQWDTLFTQGRQDAQDSPEPPSHLPIVMDRLALLRYREACRSIDPLIVEFLRSCQDTTLSLSDLIELPWEKPEKES